MPTFSRFYGISITMYAGEKEHPPPHFHAYYAGREMQVAIADGQPIVGDLPSAQTRLIKQWCELRRADLMVNWAELCT